MLMKFTRIAAAAGIALATTSTAFAGGDIYGPNQCVPVSTVNDTVAGAGTAAVLIGTGATPCT